MIKVKSSDFSSHIFLDALEVVKEINGDNDWYINSGILDIRNIIKGCVLNGFSFIHRELLLLLSVWLNLNCLLLDEMWSSDDFPIWLSEMFVPLYSSFCYLMGSFFYTHKGFKRKNLGGRIWTSISQPNQN